jgi:hypothetical protein
MERHQILNEFTLVATTVAALVISILNWINSLFDPSKLGGWQAWIVLLLAGTGTYLFLFKTAIWIYYNGVWKLVHADRYISGKWNYKYNDSYDPEKKTWDTGADRSGIADFSQTIEDISMHGESLDNEGAKPKTTTLISTWQARATALHELRIYALVAVTSATSSEDALMILYIERSERLWKLIPRVPQRVVGHYYLPPRSSTSIRYARIEFDRAS